MKSAKVVTIAKHEDYYLATSTDIPGFLCQGDTIDDVILDSPHIIDSLIQSRNERTGEIQIRDFDIIFSYRITCD